MKTQSRQRFRISKEGYWRDLLLSLEYQQRLFTEALDCETMEVVANEGDFEQGVKRKLRFVKRSDAPAPIRKVFGETNTVEEISEFDAQQECWTYRMVPAVMGDRVSIRGAIRVEDNGDGTVDQVTEQIFECKIFGIGSLVERFIARSIQQSQADKTAFTEAYIEEKQLS